MALTDPGGGGGNNRVAQLPRVTPPPVSQPPIDDATAFQLFAPQAGGATTTQGPQGGTINYAAGADPNGYFWVDDGSDAGYWYRPEDKNVWHATPVTKAADKVLANLPGPVKAPVTNAPVIRGALPPPLPVPPSSGGGGILGKIGGIAQGVGGAALDAVGQAVPMVGLGEAALEAGGAIARNIGVPLPEPSRVIPTPGRSPLRDYGALTTSVLPSAVTDTIAQDVGPVERALEFSTSPLGIWSAGISAATSPFAPSVGAAIDLASNITGELAAEGAKRAGLPTWAQVGANVVGGLGPDLGFGIAGAARGAPDAFPTYRGPRDAGGNPVPSSIAPPIPFSAPPTLARQLDDILSPEGTRLPEPVAGIADADIARRAADIRTAVSAAPLDDGVKFIPSTRSSAPPAPVPPPATRTVPTGAAVANTKKPPVNTEYAVFPNKPRNMTEVAVKVADADAGVIRRIGTSAQWEAYYRNPDGAMVPVPKNAAGDPFVGTKVQAQNVVVNAHLADGKVLQDVPKATRAPRVAAAEGAEQIPVPPRAAPSVPSTNMEAQLAASLEAIRARKAAVEGVVSPAPRSAPEVAPSTPTPRATGSPYDAEQAAARHAANPYKGGETVTYKGETYTVERPVSTKTAKGTVEGVRVTGPKGESIRVPVTEVQRTVLRPQEMTIRQMVREMDPVIPSQVRQDFYRIAAQEDRAAKFGAEKLTDAQRAGVTDVRERLQDMLGIYRRQLDEIERAAVPDIANNPAVAAANTALVKGTATDGEVAALDAIHRETLESMADDGFDEAVANWRAKRGAQVPPAPSPDAGARMLGLVDEKLTKAAEAEASGRRTVRAGRRAGRFAVEAANAPRALKASGDLSFMLRQGMILGIRHPKKWSAAVGTALNNLRNPAVAQRTMDEINAVERPWLYIAQLDEATPLTLREEQFMSSIASKIPGYRRLERSNLVFLNKLRADVYDQVVTGWRSSGKDPSALELKGLANFINHASGRGTGQWLDKFGPALSVAMFSPRYTASRFQAPLDVLTATGRARGYAATAMAANIAAQTTTAATVLFLLHNAGLDVSIDPRSSDFGKIKFPGGFVVDTTAGMQQPIRFITQLATQSYRSTASGQVYPRSRQESVIRYLRAKASPLGGEVMDWFNVPYGFEDRSLSRRIPGIGGLVEDTLAGIERTSLPITLANAWEYFDRANTPGGYLAAAAALSAEFTGFGISAREKSEWEIRDQKIAADPEMAQYLLPGETVVNYNNLNDVGRMVAQERYGVPVSKSPTTISRREKVDAIDAKYAPRESALEEARGGWFSSDPGASDISPKDARAKARQISAEKRAETSTLYPEDIPVDERRVLDRWFEAIEQYTDALGDTDWDAIEAWEGQQSPEDRAILHEVQRMWSEEKTGIAGDDRRVADALSDSGFFELRDQAWVEYANAERIDLQQFPDVWTYKASVRAAKIAEYEPIYGPSMARQQAAKDADKAVTEFGDHYEQRYLRPWMLEHTDLARQGADFQYISVDQEELKAIYMGDTAELQGTRQKFEAVDGLERAGYVYTPGTTTSDEQVANIIALWRQDPELARTANANNLLGGLSKAEKEALAKAGVVLE